MARKSRKPDWYIIVGGSVCRSDEDTGTTRPMWRASVTVRARFEWCGLEFEHKGDGSGKRPHVAARRAIDDAIQRAERV